MQAVQSASTQGAPGTIMGFTMGAIICSIIFSGIGLLYVRQGRITGEMRTILIGVALMLYPYFISDTLYMIAVGLGLMALPWVLDKF